MVHSRIGLAFTGLVEIVVSTITSVSVCALVGFRVTMVPWELFPIIVVFIGVENMYSIVSVIPVILDLDRSFNVSSRLTLLSKRPLLSQSRSGSRRV